jgi:hypothetical protein
MSDDGDSKRLYNVGQLYTTPRGAHPIALPRYNGRIWTRTYSTIVVLNPMNGLHVEMQRNFSLALDPIAGGKLIWAVLR